MRPGMRTRLSAMMFLYYLALGAWCVTGSTYLMKPPAQGGLSFSSVQVGWIYSTFALGGMLATPLVGLLIDRLFRAEVVFSIANLLAGGLLFLAARHCEASEAIIAAASATEIDPAVSHAFGRLFAIMLAVSFCLQIALTLCTVLCLRNLPDPSHQFARTRMYGTVGWVIILNLMGFFLNPVSSEPFDLAAYASLALGLYGFTLPRTPPLHNGRTIGEAFGLPAFQLFRNRSFCVFILAAVILSQMNQFYGVYAHRYFTDSGISHPERWMTIGQVVEIVCMFLIPILKPKDHLKSLMLLGLFGGVLRYAALMIGEEWLIFGLGVPMHGWCFAFYFVVAATYLDQIAPTHLRASTQAIAAFIASGLGPWTGNYMASHIVDFFEANDRVDWQSVWLMPTAGSIVAFGLFAIGFYPKPRTESKSPPYATALIDIDSSIVVPRLAEAEHP